MNEISFRDKDLLVMKLLHYFITEEKYNPIILRGVDNEIWLENMDAHYKIVRINTGYVHNNEQLDFDMFKTKKILNKIKLKTLSLSLNTLSLFVDLGDNVNLTNDKNIDCVKVMNEDDVFTSKLIIDAYPSINEKLIFDEKGMELFSKITTDINKKNMIDQREAEEIFTPKKPIVTYVIMGLCIIIYIITEILSISYNQDPTSTTSGLTMNNYVLLLFGALNKTLVVDYYQVYRVISAAFLHGSLMHILTNMYSLFIIGKDVEGFYGKNRFIVIYLVSAVFGSLTSMLFSSTGISVGASGAIFGLLGALLYFGYHYRTVLNNAITKQVLPIIVLNLFLGFTSSGIDNFAHIGGLFGGIMASMAVGVKYRSTKKEKINGIIVCILMFIFLVCMLYK